MSKRDAFEKWLSGRVNVELGDDGFYMNYDTENAWIAWQASSQHSRALLEMALEALEQANIWGSNYNLSQSRNPYAGSWNGFPEFKTKTAIAAIKNALEDSGRE